MSDPNVIVIDCDCGTQLKAKSEWIGRKAKCSSCGKVHPIQAPTSAPTVSSTPPSQTVPSTPPPLAQRQTLAVAPDNRDEQSVEREPVEREMTRRLKALLAWIIVAVVLVVTGILIFTFWPSNHDEEMVAKADSPRSGPKNPGPEVKGKHWVSTTETLFRGETIRPGKRFFIWPAEDRVFKLQANAGALGQTVTRWPLKLKWRLLNNDKSPIPGRVYYILYGVNFVSLGHSPLKIAKDEKGGEINLDFELGNVTGNGRIIVTMGGQGSGALTVNPASNLLVLKVDVSPP